MPENGKIHPKNPEFKNNAENISPMFYIFVSGKCSGKA